MQGTIKNVNDIQYLIIGGDDRFLELVKLYKQKGAQITTYGMEKAEFSDVYNHQNLEDAINSCDIIIAPIPFSKEHNLVNAIYSASPIKIDELFSCIKNKKLLYAGALNPYAKKLAEENNIDYIDYNMDESYQILNAIPTAEGTIEIIINETDKTIYERKIMILGYGRIGKILANYLRALGAEVFVEARKDYDLTWITIKGMKAVPLNELKKYTGSMEVIVNTVPDLIVTPQILDNIDKDTLIIDLASKPGGVDFEYAKKKGIKAIHALSIPGKIAYKSAALYIFDTINRLINERFIDENTDL